MRSEIQTKFDSYPENVRVTLLKVRDLIYETARKEGIDEIEETLKWGEPSYISKIGSTVRIDWKAKSPEKYYIYFNCQTKLVETFKELYGDVLKFEGNRAIVLCLSESLPEKIIEHCLSLALKYKLLKHLELLGE